MQVVEEGGDAGEDRVGEGGGDDAAEVVEAEEEGVVRWGGRVGEVGWDGVGEDGGFEALVDVAGEEVDDGEKGEEEEVRRDGQRHGRGSVVEGLGS